MFGIGWEAFGGLLAVLIVGLVQGVLESLRGPRVGYAVGALAGLATLGIAWLTRDLVDDAARAIIAMVAWAAFGLTLLVALFLDTRR